MNKVDLVKNTQITYSKTKPATKQTPVHRQEQLIAVTLHALLSSEVHPCGRQNLKVVRCKLLKLLTKNARCTWFSRI